MSETCIADLNHVAGLDGLDKGLEVLFTCRDILQQDPVMDGLAVCQDGAHRERIEHPALQRIVVKHFRVVDVVPVTILCIALDNNSEHV